MINLFIVDWRRIFLLQDDFFIIVLSFIVYRWSVVAVGLNIASENGILLLFGSRLCRPGDWSEFIRIGVSRRVGFRLSSYVWSCCRLSGGLCWTGADMLTDTDWYIEMTYLDRVPTLGANDSSCGDIFWTDAFVRGLMPSGDTVVIPPPYFTSPGEGGLFIGLSFRG